MKSKDSVHREKENRTRFTLVVNYPNLCAGGIETSLAALIRYSLEKGNRVVWVTNKYYLERVAFEGITDNKNLEVVVHEKFRRILGIPNIRFEENEKIIMITCRAMQYIISEGIKRKSVSKDFKHFLVVAHYTGNTYYPDRWIKIGHNMVYKFYRKIVKRLVHNDCLRAFSLKHLECYETYYNVTINNKVEKTIPLFSQVEFFDTDNIYIRSHEREDKFIITSCLRFEFPHKGYVLGLIDVFEKIKKIYPQVLLQIAGYGKGEGELRKKINRLPDHIKKDIILLGMVSPDKLKESYKASHLVIGLAGAIHDGAKSGIPSLVVRHYCCDCETYGYYDKAYDKILSDEQGEDILPFIEACITMSDEEYIAYAKKGYEAAHSKYKINPDYFFEQDKAKSDITVYYPIEAIIGRILYMITELKDRFRS